MWNISGMNGDRLHDPVFFSGAGSGEKSRIRAAGPPDSAFFFRLRERDRSASDFFVAAGILSGAPDRKKSVNPLDFIVIT